MRKSTPEAAYSAAFESLESLSPSASPGKCYENTFGAYWLAYNPNTAYAETTKGHRLAPGAVYVESGGFPVAMFWDDGGYTMNGDGDTAAAIKGAIDG